MPRLTADVWETVRAEREAGASFPELAAKWGVSHTAIIKRSKLGNWGDGQDVAAVIRRKVSEKVSGIVSTENPKKKAEAIDAAADKSAAIVAIHRQEWADHRDRFGSVPEDFDQGKLAKISVEMLKIRQEGEARAWGLHPDSQPADSGRVTIYVPDNGR